jgi:CheY-like chemotaxis protein
MSPKLLIVDDQEDIRLMLRIVLEDQGWDTEQAMSGEDALDGVQVARKFREGGFKRPIIICSAYLTPQVEAEARALGAETVSKSKFEELVQTVRRRVTRD